MTKEEMQSAFCALDEAHDRIVKVDKDRMAQVNETSDLDDAIKDAANFAVGAVVNSGIEGEWSQDSANAFLLRSILAVVEKTRTRLAVKMARNVCKRD